MHDIYISGKYDRDNPSWHVEDSPWKAMQVIKVLERNHIQPKTIVEIGCGAGGILRQLSLHLPHHMRFTGYEISPQAFQLCQQRSSG